jgi:hypothetical protein
MLAAGHPANENASVRLTLARRRTFALRGRSGAKGRAPLPYQGQAVVVLARWREVERRLAELDADHPDIPLLQAEAARLRDEYQALIRAALEADRPVPPPFPETSRD